MATAVRKIHEGFTNSIKLQKSKHCITFKERLPLELGGKIDQLEVGIFLVKDNLMMTLDYMGRMGFSK